MTQWSTANPAILDTLVSDGTLNKTGLLDYLSHTARIYQLLDRYVPPGVYAYDREYRNQKALYQFCWGTDVGGIVRGTNHYS